jgi:DNA polymerase-3 subunit gamma/tau
MSYLVLALKWRPQRFADVIGQGSVSRTLSNALKSGRAAQAYLFAGPRGVGKTSMARILAKALNCERGPKEEPCNECGPCREITAGRAMDVIEIDGASNRGIDDIRELRESAQYAPSSLERKVYIIDEVHMLTQDAFNALLKTLEEPPRHVVFILATTEPLKVPATILSRCQRFDFARLGARDAYTRLRQICDAEGIAAEDEALHLIARKGEGSMRDALTLLDQVVATGSTPLQAEEIRRTLGISGYELLFAWTEAILDRDTARALRSLNAAVEGGASLQELAEEFLRHLRNLLLVATDASLTDLLEATEEECAAYRRQATRFTSADLLRYCRLVLETAGAMRRSAFPKIHLEVALAEICNLPTALDLKRFIDATRGRFPETERAATPRPPRAKGDAGQEGPGGTAGSSPARRAGASPESPAAKSAAATTPPPGDAAPAVNPPPRHAERAANPQPEVAAEFDSSVTNPVPEEFWSDILSAMVSQKPALAAYLSGSVVVGEEGRALRIGVPGLQAFQREQLERKANKQYLIGLIEKRYGRSLAIRFEAVGATGTSAPSKPPAPGQAPPGEGSARMASSDRIRRIADLFDGDVVGPA